MPRWLAKALARIHVLTSGGAFRLTKKAEEEATALDLRREDVERLLLSLAPSDFAERITSVVTGEWMYVFVPSLEGLPLYVKLVLRAQCIVVSFHEDEQETTDA